MGTLGHTELWAFLKAIGWEERNGILVRFSKPRLGYKRDGTLIIGYHEYPEKIKSIEQFNEMLCKNLIKDFWLRKENPIRKP